MLVHEVMSTGVVTARKTDTVRSAVVKMLSRHFASVPVVEDDGTICGIVTSTDLLKSYQQLLEMVRKQAG